MLYASHSRHGCCPIQRTSLFPGIALNLECRHSRIVLMCLEAVVQHFILEGVLAGGVREDALLHQRIAQLQGFVHIRNKPLIEHHML